MIDVALSIMALIAGGLVLELFAAASPSLAEPSLEITFETVQLAEEAGNPS
jgi:hypothetical protein